MRNATFLHGVKNTPKILRILLWSMISISLFSAALNKFFIQALNILGTQELLSLSFTGAQNGFLWQPLTYLFVHPAEDGISIWFLLHLFFNIYLLCTVGASVIQRVGASAFLRLYIISGIIAGFFGLWLINASESPTLIAGASPAIYALIVAWTMLFRDLEILLLHKVSVKAKWIVIGFLGLTLLTDLSDGHFITFAIYTVGALSGYLYGVIAWGLSGPFQFTQRFDHFLGSLSHLIRRKASHLFKPADKVRKGPKIYDIKTGEVILDDTFDKRSADHSGTQ